MQLCIFVIKHCDGGTPADLKHVHIGKRLQITCTAACRRLLTNNAVMKKCHMAMGVVHTEQFRDELNIAP